MKNPSLATDRRSFVAPVISVGLASLLVGTAVPIFPNQALWALGLAVATGWLLTLFRLFDLLLWACLFVFLFAQFQTPVFDLSRWCLLFALLIVSGFLLRGESLRANPVSTGLSLVAVYAIATSFQSYYPDISLQKGVSLLLLAGCVHFVPPAIERLHAGLEAREFVLRIYAWLAVGIVISNAVFMLGRPSAAFLAGRFRGWFMNPNGIGAVYGVFLIPVLASETKLPKPDLQKLAFGGVLLAAVVQLLASQSRAGITAGVVSLAVLILPKQSLPKKALVIAVTGFVFLTMLFGFAGRDLDKRLLLRNEVVFEGSGRFPVWVEIWQRFVSKPILGSGLGVAETGSAPVAMAFNSAGYTIEKGNSYLGLLEELGALGTAVVLVAILLPLLRACARGLGLSPPRGRKPDLRLVAIVMAGLANAMFEAWLFSVGSILSLSFWLFASLLLRMESRCPAE